MLKRRANQVKAFPEHGCRSWRLERQAVGQFERRVFAKQALSNARRASRKIARRPKARSAGGNSRSALHEWLPRGDRARQADKTSLRLTVFRGGVGSRNPTPRGRPAQRFGVCRLCGQPRALAFAAATHTALTSSGHLAMRAVSTRSESNFSGRCDRDCGANALRST